MPPKSASRGVKRTSSGTAVTPSGAGSASAGVTTGAPTIDEDLKKLLLREIEYFRFSDRNFEHRADHKSCLGGGILIVGASDVCGRSKKYLDGEYVRVCRRDRDELKNTTDMDVLFHNAHTMEPCVLMISEFETLTDELYKHFVTKMNLVASRRDMVSVLCFSEDRNLPVLLSEDVRKVLTIRVLVEAERD